LPERHLAQYQPNLLLKKKRDKEKNQMKYYTIIEERGGERIIKYMDVLDTRTIDRGY